MTATTTPRRMNRFALGALLLAAVLVAFFLGQRAGRPTGSAVASFGADHEEKSHAGEGHGEGEAGVVHFEPEALELAGLTIEPAVLRPLRTRLELTGTVEPNLGGVVKITPRVSGKITVVRVNIGDNVQQRQVLAHLESTELAAAQAAYRQAGARMSLARINLQRQQRLAGLGEFGRHKVEEARQREIQAHGEINQAQAELAAAKNGVVEARSERAALEGDVARSENEVASAESEIAEALSKVRALQAALAQAETGNKVAESKFNRYDRLIKEELISRQDWEQAHADKEQARSNVDVARANIAQGEAEVNTARAHKAAAQAQVRASRSRLQQASDKIETLLARQKQVDERLATANKQDEIAEQALAREERVYKGGFLTTKEILDAEAAVWLAQAEQRAAADTVRLLGGTPGGGNTIPVTAPLAGRVTDRTVTLGETVDPTKTLFTVVNLNSVWVQLAVSQSDLPHVRLGQAMTVTSDAAPGRTLSGTVAYVGDLVDETTRTVKVRAVIQNPGSVLKPQTFVRGALAADIRTNVLAVPREAVQTLEGKTVVFVQGDRPDEFEAKEVETGDTVGGITVITAGLQAGSKVVTKGAFTVKAQAMKAELGHEH